MQGKVGTKRIMIHDSTLPLTVLNFKSNPSHLGWLGRYIILRLYHTWQAGCSQENALSPPYGWGSWKIPSGILNFVRHRYGCFRTWVRLFWDTHSMEPIQDPTPYAGDGWLNLQKDGPQEQRGTRFFGGPTLPATNSSPTENQWLDCFQGPCQY